MVAVTVAAVGGETRERRVRLAMWHFAGLAVGAFILALLATAVGHGLPVPEPEAPAILGAASVLWGITTAAGRPLPVVSSAAQVPAAWFHTMTPRQFAFGYGVGLGLGVLTRIRSFSFFAFVGLLVLLADPLIGIVVAGLYASARAVPVFMASLSDRKDRVLSDEGSLRSAVVRADGVALILVGVALVSSLV